MEAFAVLGLTPGASLPEIKRAYRRLAMHWHPDRNRSPEATERFKIIGAAYAALQAGAGVGAGEAASSSAAEADDLPRAADICLEFEIGLEEGVCGCLKTVAVRRDRHCRTCEGTGEAGISRSELCKACHGSGRVRHHRHLERCPICDGRGFISRRICGDCGGSGRHEEVVTLQVTVPAGMLEGEELRLVGQGQPGSTEQRAGDLLLAIVMRPHALFELQGRDLAFAMPVNGLLLLAGGEIEVPTPLGGMVMTLAPGSIEARTLRLAGRGYPGRRTAPAGDLVVTLQPVWPQAFTAEQRRLLQQVAAACDDTLPEIVAWRQRLG